MVVVAVMEVMGVMGVVELVGVVVDMGARVVVMGCREGVGEAEARKRRTQVEGVHIIEALRIRQRASSVDVHRFGRGVGAMSSPWHRAAAVGGDLGPLQLLLCAVACKYARCLHLYTYIYLCVYLSI